MKRLFVSQPMKDRSTNDVAKERSAIAEKFKGEYCIADSFFDYTVVEQVNEPLYKLGDALGVLAWCDAAYFCDDWERYRGCVIEHMACERYGIEIIHD